MPTFAHVCTYQNFIGQACEYRRSEGLQPEPGWIDLDLADVGKIDISQRTTLWRSVNGFEVPAPVSIDTWFAIATRATVTTPPPIGPPSAGGLSPFGDLVLITLRNDGALPAQRYHDIYVDRSGMEEIGDQIAAIKDHTRGDIRVPLTDIRQFYAEYSGFVGDINVILPSGEFDRNTIKDFDTCEPWPATDVVRYLFSQLPGSPIVNNRSELFTGNLVLEPPSDIIGRGDIPVVQILQQVLDRLGVVPKMLPDGNYLVDRKASDKTPLDRIPTDVGVFDEFVDEHYERQTVWATARPHAIHVFGEPPIRRVTLPYVPVFRDLDNRWYNLFSAPIRWGWNIGGLLSGITMGQEKRWRDIPPKSGPLHFDRVDIANRDFFRVYAPAHMFAKVEQCPGRPVASGGLESFAEEDFDRSEYLPMKAAPLYNFEFESLGSAVPNANTSFQGDQDFMSLSAPIVRGAHFTEGLFTNFDEIQAHFNSLSTANSRTVTEMTTGLALAQARLAALGQQIVKQTSDAMLAGFSSDKARAKFMALLKTQPNPIQVDQDLSNAFAEVGVGIGSQMVLEEGTHSTQSLKVGRLRREVEGWKQSLSLANGKQTQNVRQFSKLKKIYDKLGGVQLRANSPHTVVKTGYSLDTRTGILTFSEPFFQAFDPFVLDGDDTVAASDGLVYVTFGYEVREGNSGDVTSVLFSVNENAAGIPSIKVVGGQRPTTLKGKIVRAPKMRLYQTDIGEPMNATQVIAQASARAAGLLQVPIIRQGRTYELIGFRKAVLEGGVNSIQHTFDGTIAKTTFMVNAPAARGPLGPADITGIQDTERQNTREMIASIDPRFQ